MGNIKPSFIEAMIAAENLVREKRERFEETATRSIGPLLFLLDSLELRIDHVIAEKVFADVDAQKISSLESMLIVLREINIGPKGNILEALAEDRDQKIRKKIKEAVRALASLRNNIAHPRRIRSRLILAIEWKDKLHDVLGSGFDVFKGICNQLTENLTALFPEIDAHKTKLQKKRSKDAYIQALREVEHNSIENIATTSA